MLKDLQKNPVQEETKDKGWVPVGAKAVVSDADQKQRNLFMETFRKTQGLALWQQ